MSTTVRDDLILSHAVVTADVETSFHDVDIAQWLKTLPRMNISAAHPGTTRRPATPSTTTARRCPSTSR